MQTMAALYQSKAVLVSATMRPIKIRWWPGRFARPSGTRHELYIIDANDIKLARKATQFLKVAAARKSPRSLARQR